MTCLEDNDQKRLLGQAIFEHQNFGTPKTG